MELKPAQLKNHLESGLVPFYFIAGDDPFLLDQCSAAIRQRAKSDGYSDRQVLSVEAGFDWQALLNSSQSLSLFSEKRMFEIRINSGKPGDAGAKILTQLALNPPADTIFMISANKFDKRSRQSKWVKALAAAGTMITVYPIDPAQFPSWLAGQLKSKGIHAQADVVKLLAHHFEGNCLAAAQEIDKLALLFNEKTITSDEIIEFLSDNAQFTVFSLVDKCLNGDAGEVIRTLDRLRRDGIAPTLVLWAIARELRLLAQISDSVTAGQSQQQVFQHYNVWAKRQSMVRKALSRLRSGQWLALLQRASRVDRIIKGRLAGESWQELKVICLAICGLRPPPIIS